MEKDNKKIVMFDFDGVLVNTLEHAYDIHKIKNKDLTWENFQDFSNGNFHDGAQKAIEEGTLIPSDNFYDQYAKKLGEMTIHDVLHESVISLSSAYRLVVVSSTESSIIDRFLSKEGIRDRFDDILGHEIHRSKIVKIGMVLEKYHAEAKDTVFITDTLGDIKEANDCKVSSIGVTWGLHERSNLEKGDPALVIDDPIDLISAIETVLK